MKYLLHRLLLGLIGLTLLASCQEVVDIDVPNSETNIVIVGRVTDLKGTQVKVSLTAPYFSQSTTPTVDSARVLLFENGVMVSQLTRDSLPGNYSTTYNGIIGKSYEIEVSVPAGTQGFQESTWRSAPELLRPTVVLDSFKIQFLERPTVFEEGDYAQVFFRELPGPGDHYRITRWRNDSLITQDINITDDLAIDGLYFGGPDFPAYAYNGPLQRIGDSLGIEVSSISLEYYNFLNLIISQVFQVGSTFDPPPAPVIGNIYNVDNPDQYGFGYFAASGLATGGVTYKN